jgi:hypothetical protein
MKNRQIYILCFILTFLLLSTLIYGQELGDVNSDNNIDIVDALLTAQYYVGLNPSGFNPDVADTNGDGMADIVDALLIAQYYVGLITEFPGAGTPVPTETPEITPTATPGETPSGIEGMGLVLQYMCQEPQPDVKTIKPRFNIINGGTDTINLGGIKIRYWYTKESWAEEVLDVPYARIGQEYVSGVFYYNCLEVSIADQAGTLAPSGETGNINLAFHNVDWDVYNQSDDYSFDPSFTDFADWEKVTLLYYSYQVWGTDPYGNGPGSIPGPVPTEPPLPTPMANKPFEEDYSQKAAASVITGGSAPGIASGSSVTIDVDTNAVKRRIPQTIMGNNVGVWIGKTWFEDQGFKDRIAAINTSLLRFPGGSRGDRYHWDENYPQYLHNQGWVPEPGYAVDTASLMRVCYETGSKLGGILQQPE